MIITIQELEQTELYPEVIDVISRSSEDAVILQIMAAESFCKSYLFKYDLQAAFGTANTPPSVESPMLKKIVKTITAYYLLRMANPNVNLELYQGEYEAVVKLLEDIRDGNNNITELPYQTDDPDTPEVEGELSTSWSSNPKRKNHF